MTPVLNPDIPEHNEFLNWLTAVVILTELAIERGDPLFFTPQQQVLIPDDRMWSENITQSLIG